MLLGTLIQSLSWRNRSVGGARKVSHLPPSPLSSGDAPTKFGFGELNRDPVGSEADRESPLFFVAIGTRNCQVYGITGHYLHLSTEIRLSKWTYQQDSG
jgi:hypothetical protein